MTLDRSMIARDVCVGISISCGGIAFVGVFALYEHWAGLKGSEWLEKIFPFGLALDRTTLLGITVTAGLLSWLFHKLATRR
jgi:hypothetical protein